MKENVEFKHFQSIASLADPALGLVYTSRYSRI